MKGKKKEINITKHVAVFSTICVVFFVGVYLGSYISQEKTSEYYETQEKIKNQLLSIEVQSQLMKVYPCDVDITSMTKEKADLGGKLESLEKSLGKNNPKLESMKKEYDLLSIRQWLLLEELKQKCDRKLDIILFFYSNVIEPEESEKQGYVLDYYYSKHPSVVIFALDADLDLDATRTLRNIFNITKTPATVIEGKTYEGVQTAEKIGSILK